MRPWLSQSLLGAGIFSAAWIGAVSYWRATNRMPNNSDLALYLLVLPLALLLVFWFARKLPAMLASLTAVSAAAPQPAAGAEPPLKRHGPALDIVAGAIRVPHGQSAQELLDAIASKQARLGLDPELSDDYGYPVMSGRIGDVDELAQEEAMAGWLGQNGLGELHFSPEQWRALALGSAVVTELAQHAAMHQLLPDYEPETPAALALPVLQLVTVLPAEWGDAQREAARQWLLHLIREQGWPAERLALSAAGRQGATPFALIDQLSLQCERAALPCLAIVLACASHIGEDSVRDWAERGMLFTSNNPNGQIPGEGAAGLLLADGPQALLIDDASSVQLHGAAEGRREAGAGVLAALSKEALLEGSGGEAAVSLIAADTDQRTSRITELMTMANATLPQLDLSTQVIGVAALCGSAGAVSSITALALARQEVVNNASHVLCVSNQDPEQRCAVMVRPKTTSQA